jgi:hypothetical protein
MTETSPDPLRALDEISVDVALSSGPGMPDAKRRVLEQHAPRMVAGYEALLKLAAELDRPASDLRDPNPVAAMEAMAFMHAAARIRKTIAAALEGTPET